MTVTRFPIHLARCAAKTWQEYLDAHDGDAARAGQAARNDVANREGQNSAARRFQQAYGPIVKTLGLPEAPDDTEAAGTQAGEAVRKLQADAGASGDTAKQLAAAHKALADLGIDPAKLADGVAAAQAKFARAGDADKLDREVAYSKAAEALGFDGTKLARQLRDEASLPELRKEKVKVKDAAGNETEQEQEVWGVAVKDAQGKETGFTHLAEHPDVKGWEAALKKTDSAPAPAPAVVTPATPLFVSQPTTPPTTQATVQLSAAAVLPRGAGTV